MERCFLSKSPQRQWLLEVIWLRQYSPPGPICVSMFVYVLAGDVMGGGLCNINPPGSVGISRNERRDEEKTHSLWTALWMWVTVGAGVGRRVTVGLVVCSRTRLTQSKQAGTTGSGAKTDPRAWQLAIRCPRGILVRSGGGGQLSKWGQKGSGSGAPVPTK